MRSIKQNTLIAAAAFAAAVALPAAAMAGAHGAAAGGMSASHISAGGLANTNGPNAATKLDGADRATLRSNGASAGGSMDSSMTATPNGGMSASHISASGMANTNGPNAATRVKGQDRATLRRATNASAHGSASATETPQ